MTKNYSATKEDLEAIEKALRFIWHPKMDFVFRERSKIENTVVISYDSKFIYLWTPKSSGKYQAEKIPHKLKIKDNWQFAWCAGVWDKSIKDILPESIKKATRFKTPIISGGLLSHFITLQKKRNQSSNWPYTTRESYLATIIHEFGHIYWSSYRLWWYSDKKENLLYLKFAKSLYQKRSISKVPLLLPTPASIGELFAFCTEYYASSTFWPKHKKALDKFVTERIKKLIEEEKKKDLERQDSVLEPSKNPHDFALVFGKILLSIYSHKWPEILTRELYLG